MSGMVKAKKYDWKDSNLALFGSDTEKHVKKESAETEKAWKGAGEKTGIRIWRIVKFKVTDWPKEEYGEFYNGDSYIILNTYKKPDSEELLYDVHFWIGQYSTQDEYGTAAYKTVELDTYLDDKPIQHREVMNNESSLFKSYFDSITLLKGGADTGFRHVKHAEYQPRLLQFNGAKKNINVKEVPLYKLSLDSGDVFILDLGLEIYQWNGKTCNKDEKFKAVQYLQTIKSDRGGKPKVESLDEREISTSHKFYSSLQDGSCPKDEDPFADGDSDAVKKIFRLSDAGGKMDFSLVSEGTISRDMLDPKDTFIVDTTKELIVWVGAYASLAERQNGLTRAHNYLMKTKHPLIPVVVVRDGQESSQFESAFD